MMEDNMMNDVEVLEGEVVDDTEMELNDEAAVAGENYWLELAKLIGKGVAIGTAYAAAAGGTLKLIKNWDTIKDKFKTRAEERRKARQLKKALREIEKHNKALKKLGINYVEPVPEGDETIEDSGDNGKEANED